MKAIRARVLAAPTKSAYRDSDVSSAFGAAQPRGKDHGTMTVFDAESLKKYVAALDTVPPTINMVTLAIVGDSDEVALHVATRLNTEKGMRWSVGAAVGYMPKQKNWKVGANVLVTWPRR